MAAAKTAFQIGLAYWLSDQGLRRCTHEERGVWLDVLCLMHQADERGLLRWPLEDLAEAVKASTAVLESLVRKGVMGGRSASSLPNDELYAFSQIPFVFTPRHSGRYGEPVILLDEEAGDLWFSPEMVVEEHKRRRQVQSSRRVASEASRVNGTGRSERHARQLKQEPAETNRASAGRKVPDCPYTELVELFMEVLPAARRVRMVNPDSGLGKSLKARWRAAAVAEEGPYTGYETAEDGLKKWRAIFEYITESRFLMGMVGGTRGRPPFQITLAWLVGPENFDSVVNGFYHRDAATGARSTEVFASTVLGTTAEVMSIMRTRAGAPAEGQGSLL